MKSGHWILVFLIFCIGCIVGNSIAHKDITESVEILTDTIWTTVHDTLFLCVDHTITRHDTVLLASVDTLLLHDSILVEIPISEQTWEGEHYVITTEGYRVRLRDVQLSLPTIEHTTTITKTKIKHWNGGVGVLAGYGATIHGMSPYAGIGVSWGYTF